MTRVFFLATIVAPLISHLPHSDRTKSSFPPPRTKIAGPCMIPATQMPSSGYSIKLLTPEHFRSKLSSVRSTSCLQKSAFSFGTSLYAQFCFLHLAQPYLIKASKRMSWSLRSSADGSGLNPSSTNDNRRGTRLMRAIQAFQTKLNVRFNELRKDLPLKLLFLLVGFYCSTAFATVIGQTGDWDILSAAMAVAVVEGIGALMYTASLPFFVKVKNIVIMFNYWKIGLSLGLFLDSFKY